MVPRLPSPASSGFAIRTARPKDVGTLLSLIRKLAKYERLTREVKTTERALRTHLFGPRRAAQAVVAYVGERPVGFAVFFHNFSTFVGKPGLYIEDLFVEESHRGRGLGRALFHHLATLARQRGCGRMEWSVLDWNEPAIAFYRSLGARPMQEWTMFRLDEGALRRVAALEGAAATPRRP